MQKNKGGLEIVEIVLIGVSLIILTIFVFKNVPFLGQVKDFFTDSFDPEKVGGVVNLILAIFAIFFLTVIAYSAVRLLEIRKREHEHLHHEMHEYQEKRRAEAERKQHNGSSVKNPRWTKVIEYLMSDNPSDWKLGILEADSMLDDLMERLGFQGENLGERLKGASLENFRYLDQAWEAHTVRNRIAHEGDFEISSREAKRIISLYEDIFRGYEYI